MKSVNSCLNFNENTEKAFNFYQTFFCGELQIDCYKDPDINMGANGDDLNQIKQPEQITLFEISTT